jgi:hypothetical protein
MTDPYTELAEKDAIITALRERLARIEALKPRRSGYGTGWLYVPWDELREVLGHD